MLEVLNLTKYLNKFKIKILPDVGLEPTTIRLKV